MPDFYRMEADEVLDHFQVKQEQGLTAEEVAKRQEQFGKNTLPKGEGTNFLHLVISQFTDLMVIILLIAAVISFFLGDTKDVIVIMVIVILNAVLGVYQEYRAEQALAALSALQVPVVSVRRHGEVHEISAEELVPGDIVLLEEGDRISADGRLLDSINLRIEEAALTGESQPSDKFVDAIKGDKAVAVGDRSNMVFMGTNVTYGRGEMIVTATGLQTELGNIAAMLMQVEKGVTPLTRRMNQLGRFLAIGAGVLVTIVFVAGLIRGIPAPEMFLTAISLAVAAVPEGLPALITISLSLGASRMVRRHALIRRLPAVETLGSVTVICSDKTGTLTKNEMTATLLALPRHDSVEVTGIGYTPQGEFQLQESSEPLDPSSDEQVARFLKAMALSTNAHLEEVNGNGAMKVVGDTTEGALMVAAQKAGYTRERLEKTMPRVAEVPFSSERKAMTTIHKVEGEEAQQLFAHDKYIAITKGAPDQLIEWAKYEHAPEGRIELTDERRQSWLSYIDQMASEGLRVLGVAYRPLDELPEQVDETIERDLCLIGLVGILDPARPEAKDAVSVARQAGIRTIMITGDHALTAEAIARDLGILDNGQRAITGAVIDKMSEEELEKLLLSGETNCFARVSPEHKLRVVQILQRHDHIVAMTGDGVNDAPALKQADIGVAMGITGTDVSKGAAEMVLTDDNFASIVAAVEEGRAIYDNIRKFIKYLLSSNVGEILTMFSALMIGLRIPLLAIQILWINLVTDGLPAIALGFEPAEPDVMERKPRPINESIFAQGTGRHIIWVGILIAILTLGGYIIGHTALGMAPFSRTLGLENMSSNQLESVIRVDQDVIPDDWDLLTPEERLARYLTDEGQIGESHEATANKTLIGEAGRVPRTIAFTVLAFTQMFEVMAIHAGDKLSFFRVWFRKNQLLFWAVLSTFVLQLLVIYVPFLQEMLDTSPLNTAEMALSFVLGAVVLFAVEVEKVIIREEQIAH